MTELALFGFMALLLGFGLRRPFVWVLAYIYVDMLAPQKISYLLLASLPISLIVFAAAFIGWLVADSKQGSRFTLRQGLMLFLLLYCGYTTLGADFPTEAAAKWSWVWKALVFAIFLPLALRTRLRVEATVLFIVLTAGAIIISAGIKTVFSGGGGYGSLRSFVNDNNGLYEGSTMSMVAIAIIPLIAWLTRHGTIYPKEWRVTAFAAALIFAAMLIPIGTQTRTGLLCLGVLGVIMLRSVRHRFLYVGLAAAIGVIAIPFLPATFTKRMSTIENHKADQSASTRLAVWAWTLEYVGEKPMGGGFDAFRGNKLTIDLQDSETSGSTVAIDVQEKVDQGRAYHSAYFEMLGEQGWPGLSVWLLLHGLGLVHMEWIRRRLRLGESAADKSDFALATALQQGHIVYLMGAVFVGIAYLPFAFMLIALQIALTTLVRQRTQGLNARPARLARPVGQARQVRPVQQLRSGSPASGQPPVAAGDAS